jgi:hypothetical protein
MNRRLVLSFLSTLSFTGLAVLAAGCSSADAPTQAVGTTGEELTGYDTKLAGAYTFDATQGPSLGFSALVLMADGTFFQDLPVYCGGPTPCELFRVNGRWTSTSFADGSDGKLTLHSWGEAPSSYHVSVVQNGAIQLDPPSWPAPPALYDHAATYCDLDADCQGQPTPVLNQACIQGASPATVCYANACKRVCALPQ